LQQQDDYSSGERSLRAARQRFDWHQLIESSGNLRDCAAGLIFKTTLVMRFDEPCIGVL
jgi:hypothetical protein